MTKARQNHKKNIACAFTKKDFKTCGELVVFVDKEVTIKNIFICEAHINHTTETRGSE